MIDTAAALAAFLPVLTPQPRIALDTEADSLHSYFEKLCLLQLSIPGEDVLIDPLSGQPLALLFEALEGKLLVFHGADYDLRLLRRAGFERPASLFDTMIAARLCGLTEFSYSALVRRYFGVELVKGSQKANWGRRPLSAQMTEYALNDTRYLLEMADLLGAELTNLDRWKWFEQSCEKAIASASVIKEKDPDSLWRLSGHHELSPRAQHVLRALWHWRDAEAQQVDRPAFHIMNNELLLESAARLDRGDQVHVPHLRGSRLRRFEQAAHQALQGSPEEFPRPIRKPRLRATAQQEARLKELRQKRDQAAAAARLDPSLLAPKATLERLAYSPEDPPSLMPWQKELLNL